MYMQYLSGLSFSSESSSFEYHPAGLLALLIFNRLPILQICRTVAVGVENCM